MSGLNQNKTEHEKSDEFHIKNTLLKIAVILEDIKNQKSPVFTFKNLFLVIVLFVIFLFSAYLTTSKALCEKGQQVRIGYIRQLQVSDSVPASSQSLISKLSRLFNLTPAPAKYILIRNNEDVIQISISDNTDISAFSNYKAVVTGRYNTCSNTLSIDNPSALELYSDI